MDDIQGFCDEEADNLTHKIATFWDEEEQTDGGFASHNLHANHYSETANQSVDTGRFHKSEDSAPTQLSSVFNLQEVDDVSYSRHLLGLTLAMKTPASESLLDTRLQQAQDMNQVSVRSQPLSEKLKASNLPISMIKIGDWERLSRHKGDLLAKFYFAKRKLVWEVLYGPRKIKMETHLSDISAISAVMLQKQPGILKVELDKPPLFFQETDPQPRKHTKWQPVSDFTEAQALVNRIHYAAFPPGVLDKHYDKLLQHDPRLLELSQKPFPSQEYPFFNKAMMLSDLPRSSTNFNEHEPLVQYAYPPCPTISTAAPSEQSLNPNITVKFDERARNCQLERQRVVDEIVHFARGHINFQEPSVSDTAIPGNQVVLPYQSNTNDIQNNLRGDSEIEGALLAAPAPPSVQFMDLLLNQIPNNNNAYHSEIGYQISGASVDQVLQIMNNCGYFRANQLAASPSGVQRQHKEPHLDNLAPPSNSYF